MGKGDKRTKKGKISNHSWGNCRRKSKNISRQALELKNQKKTIKQNFFESK